MVFYHLYIAYFGATSIIGFRAVHWFFFSVIAFIFYPLSSGNKRMMWLDILCVAAAAVAGLYAVFNWQAVVNRAGVTTQTDIVFGIIMVIVVLEATRRVVGAVLAVTAIMFLIYAYFGPYFPDMLIHRGFSINRIISVLYMTADGIYGIPIGVSASYVVLFIIFGAIMKACGGGRFFTDFSLALVGRFQGGAAKAAVISSAFMGALSGAAVANVVTTGTFTIPLMKSRGYGSSDAGAIEAVASTGGQITPPVMGAAGFIIALLVRVPYYQVALAAIIPVLLYYLYVYLTVHKHAQRLGLTGLTKNEIPSLKQTVKERGHISIPVIILIMIIMTGQSPAIAIFWSIISALIVAMLRKTTRFTLKQLVEALGTGVKNAVTIAVACAAAGIIAGVVSLTGLGLSFSSMITELAGNSTIVALVFTMLVTILLGCGLPTTAAYIVPAILVAPALEKYGINLLAAHLFIFYFACFSTITPPVSLSAFAAAGIAETGPMKVAFKSFRFGLAGFLIPYLIVYNVAIIMQGSFFEVATAVVFAVVAVNALVGGIEGFLYHKVNIITRSSSRLRELYSFISIRHLSDGLQCNRLLSFIMPTAGCANL